MRIDYGVDRKKWTQFLDFETAHEALQDDLLLLAHGSGIRSGDQLLQFDHSIGLLIDDIVGASHFADIAYNRFPMILVGGEASVIGSLCTVSSWSTRMDTSSACVQSSAWRTERLTSRPPMTGVLLAITLPHEPNGTRFKWSGPLHRHGTHRAAPLVAFHQGRAPRTDGSARGAFVEGRACRGRSSKRVASTKHVHLAIRIPDPDRPRGSGEVDVIAITDRAVILLEVKNWGGDVLLQNNDLVQQRLLDKGEPPKPVIEKLRAKVRMLQRCSLSIDQIEMLEVLPIVVLANPKGNLSEEVLAHPEVSTVANLPAKIESLLATRKPASDDEIARQDAMLRRFGTWDVLTLTAGNATRVT